MKKTVNDGYTTMRMGITHYRMDIMAKAKEKQEYVYIKSEHNTRAYVKIFSLLVISLRKENEGYKGEKSVRYERYFKNIKFYRRQGTVYNFQSMV